MKFVKSVKLYFREGNSDKAYEIDLCEVGPDKYVVNFRYGRRNSQLKEGTKTTAPVDLQAATAVFNALEKEKRSKGYLAENEEAAPVTDMEPLDVGSVADERHKAILQRLHDALSGENSFATEWQPSRAIWKAGELRIPQATPYLAKLLEKGKTMQRYSALWALARCGGDTAIALLKTYYQNTSYPLQLRMLAANGLLLVLDEAAAAAHVQHVLEGLPENIQQAVKTGNGEALDKILQETLVRKEEDYYFLESLYVVSAQYPVVKQSLTNFLKVVPMRPSYFRHVRHIFKQSELRDDHAITALLTKRFEDASPMFAAQRIPDYDESQTYLSELGTYVTWQKELKKKNSRIAFSASTRRYMLRRVMRRLSRLGPESNTHYVRLATSLLLQYGEADRGTSSVLLTYILDGNNSALYFDKSSFAWYPASEQRNRLQQRQNEPQQGLFGKLKKLFKSGNKAPEPVPVPEQPAFKSNAPFFDRWMELPQAFLQLLIQGRLHAIHEFALTHLRQHKDYKSITGKLDIDAIAGLLASEFPLPSELGLELAKQKFDHMNPSAPLIGALLASPNPAARELGLKWARSYADICFQDTGFVTNAIFSPWPEVRAWANTQLGETFLPLEKAQLLCAKAIAWLLSLKTADNHRINEGCLTLEAYFASALRDLSIAVTEDLLKSPVQGCQAFSIRLLLLKKGQFDFSAISDQLLEQLLQNDFEPVRTGGLAILAEMPEAEQLKRPEFLRFCCLSPYPDVRQNARAIIERLLQIDPRLATWLVNELAPLLMRKEAAEGLHQSVANLLSNELAAYLHQIDQATALRLVYSNYRPAQEFGLFVLNQYIPAENFTIKQIVAAGSHELLAVRQWSWQFFHTHADRMRAEKQSAISMLDATWGDSRDLAKNFFREQFNDADWSPEILVSIADSVRPDIQAFGRELLTRFFKAEDGIQYLLKLSQHPGIAMQLFASNYLEQYATDDYERLQQLVPYFRSVLTRVNKARTTKERVFTFLEKEALKTPENALLVGNIIADVSATVAIGDKARCIGIMRNIQQQFNNVPLPIRFVDRSAAN